MQFAQPLWLLAGLAACALVLWRYRRFDRQQQAALGRFAATRLLDRLTSSVSPARRRLKRALFVTGLMLVFAALARPQAGYVWEETHRQGLELLFAVDTSKSMLSQDVKPDRLTRAKLAVHDLAEKLNGDGVGLIAFAGNAFLQCPITLDYDAFLESLDALDTNTIPRGGTDIAAAIHEAEATFKTRTASEKVLILVTDGEDLEASGIAAAQEAAKAGVKIFTVGVGTAAGDLIPTGSADAGASFVKDENGKLVKSRLDESTLRKIASATGAIYEPLGAHGEGLNAIYENGLAKFTRHDLASRRRKVYLERFQWPLLGAALCLAAGMMIGTRRRTRAPKPGARRDHRIRIRPGAATAAMALILALPHTSHASPQSAEKEDQAGNFAKAQQDYAATAAKEPGTAALQFNAGSAAYKAGDYAQASAAFQSTLKVGDVPLQQGAYYDLGNTQYREGEKTVQSNPQATIKTWEEALKSYEAALQIRASDADAKYNRDFVQKRLDLLKKQQEQKKQQQKRQQKKDQSQNEKHQNKEDQQQQSQSQSGDQKQEAKASQGGSKDQKQSQASEGQPKDQKDQSQGGQGRPKNTAKGGQEQANQPQPGADSNQAKAEQKQGSSPNAQQPPQQSQGPQNQAKAGQQAKAPPEAPGKILKGNAEAAHAEAPKDSAAQAEAANERREPGQMTKQEARQLLDALKDEEHRLPAFSQLRGGGPPRNDQPLKDW